jgi:hypothetical protein
MDNDQIEAAIAGAAKLARLSPSMRRRVLAALDAAREAQQTIERVPVALPVLEDADRCLGLVCGTLHILLDDGRDDV